MNQVERDELPLLASLVAETTPNSFLAVER
jgi:hypothetical protein